MPIAPTSTAELIGLIRKSGIVPPGKLAALSNVTLPPEAQKAAAILVAQGVVTKFQAVQLLAGRHKGFRIGAHVVLELLGRGGMGAVYLAEHQELHRKVAIKVLVPGKEENQRLALERFLREARSAAALDHPNIVRIFDVARHQEVPYLVMEYVEGESLQEILDKQGAVHYTVATEFIAQAAAGLQHAHEKGFVHRDVKPGNMMRDKTGTIKILDMGLARPTNGEDTLTARLDHGAVVGTADFISPEQAINNTVIDGRDADVYSLGATFFALLIGKPPFEGNTTQKLLQHQLKEAPTLGSLDPTLPVGLSEVVARMLAKKPEYRYQTPAEVIAALSPWMASSARLIAGLSRTRLGQNDDDIQATLSGIARGGSSRKLSTGSSATLGPYDSATIDYSEAKKDTRSLASSPTTRETNRPSPATAPPTAQPRKRRIPLFIGIGLLTFAAGGVGGWLLFGREKPVLPPTSPPPKVERERSGNS